MRRPARDSSSINAGGRSKVKSKADKPGRKRWSFGGLTVSVRLLGAAVVVGLLAVNLVPITLQWIQQEQEYRAVRAEVAAAEAYNQELQDSLDAWENKDYIASQARKRLGFVWPGETQYMVVDMPVDEDVASESEQDSKSPEKPWSTQILESMVDADTPPPSEGLREVKPTVDRDSTVGHDPAAG